MAALSSAQGEAWENDEKEDRVRYVEELDGEGDYWLSITDAARVCRVQDVSIRRAITRGALPVRKQRAGQNKRTRFVRAHDLATAGFPIIDESAAITTEVGKADILSIPRQQQHILQEHQRLMGSLEEMQQSLAEYQARTLAGLQELREHFQMELRTWREESLQQIASLETHLAQTQERWLARLVEAEQQQSRERAQLEQRIAQLSQQLGQEQLQRSQAFTHIQTEIHQQETRFQDSLRSQQTALEASQAQSRQEIEHLKVAQQEYLQQTQQRMLETLQRAEQQTGEQLERLEKLLSSKIESAVQTSADQFSKLAGQISPLQSDHEGLKQQVVLKEQETASALQKQQAQLDQHAQLLPLLPYSGQSLVNEQALEELENRWLARQKADQENMQRLLGLLTPERLAALDQLLTQQPKQPD